MFNWLKSTFSKQPAFLIGSRIYGSPRQDSDIDLVIMCDDASSSKLYYRSKNGKRDKESGSYSLSFDNLNLIVCTKPEVYQCWVNGFKECMSLFERTKTPLTRSMAKGIFQSHRVGVNYPAHKRRGL